LWEGWQRNAVKYDLTGNTQRVSAAYEQAYIFFMKESVSRLCAKAINAVRK
jgi:hypothetical protein